LQMAEIAVEMPGTLVDEQQVVTVAVAHQMAHGAVGLPQPQLDIGIVQRQRRLQWAVALAGDVVEVEGMRAQRAFPVDPASRRMLVMQVRSGAEEAFAAHLALEGALREIAVRLTRAVPFADGETDPFAAHMALLVISRDLKAWTERRGEDCEASSTRLGGGPMRACCSRYTRGCAARHPPYAYPPRSWRRTYSSALITPRR